MTLLTTLVAILPLALSVAAQGGGQTCGANKLCPASAPCCSEYGFCGTGNFCLGGCNPLWSNKLDSCRPNPVCKDATYTFADTSRIWPNATTFDGNSTAYDWVLESGNILSTGTDIQLLLTEKNGGSKISLTKYLHYGTVTARMKTGMWKGVVTAFITMSNVRDEIDWEWPGAVTTEAQTNYFWMGVVPDYSVNHGATAKDLSNTFENYHDYTIDWQQDTLKFLIDGKEVRSIDRASTANAAANGRTEYPTTPSRIQISLWPAGIPGSGQGTVEWAGGMIDWSDPYYAANGHFLTSVQSVSVKCADTASLPPGTQSYVYGANDTNSIPTVGYSNSTGVTNAGSRAAPMQSGLISMAVFLGAIGGFAALVL
jgi:beta-glucanase (GH16 family)